MTDPRDAITVHRAGADGVPVLTYVRGMREHRPWAERVEVVGPRPADLILTDLAGWAVSCDETLGRELVARGAVPVRHGHRMSRDLNTDPAPSFWASLDPPPPIRIAVELPTPRALLPTWRAAYPPSHPDHFPGDDDTVLSERLIPLYGGQLHGPLLHHLTALDGDRVVAASVVNHVPGAGPWLTELFRHPAASYAGLGTLLLRRTLSWASHTLSLVVTRTNPARRLYERHGFRLTQTFLTVVIPDSEPR
jgi:GNAT superfamily N-acetyltransferase